MSTVRFVSALLFISAASSVVIKQRARQIIDTCAVSAGIPIGIGRRNLLEPPRTHGTKNFVLCIVSSLKKISYNGYKLYGSVQEWTKTFATYARIVSKYMAICEPTLNYQ
ncbi:unnamed protein product [Phyllotreta striolata]|uniref:Secreted protein n=1 Tax=Phyllotreta striolata TaxID=444603 RepID=A0A9N9TH38_PHYSR|nr:unnamed protein product [Phyllotreta striolata]